MTDGSDPSAFASEDLDVRVSDDSLVVSATITRPERRNALNEAVLQGLRSVTAAADESAARGRESCAETVEIRSQSGLRTRPSTRRRPRPSRVPRSGRWLRLRGQSVGSDHFDAG